MAGRVFRMGPMMPCPLCDKLVKCHGLPRRPLNHKFKGEWCKGGHRSHRGESLAHQAEKRHCSTGRVAKQPREILVTYRPAVRKGNAEGGPRKISVGVACRCQGEKGDSMTSDSREAAEARAHGADLALLHGGGVGRPASTPLAACGPPGHMLQLAECRTVRSRAPKAAKRTRDGRGCMNNWPMRAW